MTIREIIKRLEELDKDVTLKIWDNFGFEFSSDFDVFSWRGSYDLPAIELSTGLKTTAEEALENLIKAKGRVVHGYKGGEFTISENDEVYLVASYNTSGKSTIITEIDDYGRCQTKDDMYC